MKHFPFSTIGSFVLGAMILLSSCAKDGAQDPKGDKGETGAAGGSQVYYSDWKNLTFKVIPDGPDADIDPDGYKATIIAPQLTADIINKGEVKVYLNFATAGSPAIVTIPYNDVIVPVYSVGKIDLISITPKVSSTQTGQLQYRYIIIPGLKG